MECLEARKSAETIFPFSFFSEFCCFLMKASKMPQKKFSSENSRRLLLSEIPCWKGFPSNFDGAGKSSPIFLNKENENIYLHRSGPILENCLDRPENRYGRYGFAKFSSMSISTVGVDGTRVSL